MQQPSSCLLVAGGSHRRPLALLQGWGVAPSGSVGKEQLKPYLPHGANLNGMGISRAWKSLAISAATRDDHPNATPAGCGGYGH